MVLCLTEMCTNDFFTNFFKNGQIREFLQSQNGRPRILNLWTQNYTDRVHAVNRRSGVCLFVCPSFPTAAAAATRVCCGDTANVRFVRLVRAPIRLF